MLVEPSPSPVSWQEGGPGAGLTEVHAGADGTVEVEANLLFLGHYARDHADLVISDGHHAVRVRDYFAEGARPTLRSADGASLPESTVAGLVAAGTPLQVAETAGGEARPESRPVGRVETADGGATALRNGVTVTLRAGDLVFKGDVLTTDDGGHLAVTFIDGTAFNLDGESRMVVDGMTFHEGGAGNSALFSLVQGAITFVAGQTAKTGDMKVSTPTATMGIRGTAVHVEIASDRGTVKFSVMTEPDGHTGRYDVYANDDPGHVLFTVSDPGVATTVTPNGQGPLSVVSTAKSATDLAREDSLVKGVFGTVASGQQRPIVQPPTDVPVLHPNAPTSSPAGGSSSPPSLIIPDKGFAPSSPAAPDQPANHALADPTTTGSIGKSVAAVATAFVSSAVADAHGVTLAAAVAAAPPVVVAPVIRDVPGTPATGGLSLPTGAFLGSGASGHSSASTGSEAASAAASTEPAKATQIPDLPPASVAPAPGAPAVETAAPSPALAVGRALSASAVPGGQPLTVDLLAGVTGGAQGATLSIGDMTYALGQAAAAHALPPGVTLAGSSLIFAPSVLASRGAPGTTGTITIGFDISDGHGASVHQSLVVTLAPSNTGPTLTLDAPPHAMTEAPNVTAGPGTLAATANLSFTDPDFGQTHRASLDIGDPVWSAGPLSPGILAPGLKAILGRAATLAFTDTDASGTGHVTVAFAAPDKTFDFLAVGETLQLTSTVSVTDAAGMTASQPVTFTIAGSNDAPVFDGPAPHSVAVGPVGPGPGRGQTSGSLHFTDADLSDKPTASILKQTVTGHDTAGPDFALTAAQTATLEKAFTLATHGTNTGTVDWTYTIANAALSFLSTGQSVELSTTIVLDDHHGGLATQAITLDLTAPPTPVGPAPTFGALPDIDGVVRGQEVDADAAHGVLSNDTAGGPGAGLSVVSATGASGQSVVLPTVPLIGQFLGPLGALLPFGLGTLHTDITGTYGTLTLASDGSYSYTADKAPSLGGDDVAQDTFTYTTQDTRGHSATSTLTFTITGRGADYTSPTGLNDGTNHTLVGANGPTVLDGGNGDDTLTAGHGPTVLIGGPGDDILTGGHSPATFIFNRGFGHDTVTSFDADHDTLQFGHDVFTSQADVLSHAVDQAGGVLITAPGGDTVLLVNLTVQALTADHDAVRIV